MLKKTTGHAPSLASAAGVGMAISILWTLGLAALTAKLLDTQMLEMEQVGYAALVILLSAGMLAACLSGRKAGHQAVAASALALLGYVLCLLAVNALFFGGSFTGLGVDLVVLIAGGLIGLLMQRRGRGGAKRKRYKIRK